MSIKADFHLHSYFSGDSDAPMEQMILSAIELGLTQMCFTEHMDLDFPVTELDSEGKFECNIDSYLYELIGLREKYKDKIKVLFGLELGMQPHLARRHAIITKSYDFDFIIGSSHICNGKDPYYPAFYEGRSEEEAYSEYFASIVDNIKKFKNFDVYGHLDYVVRYGPNRDAEYTYEKYQDLLDEILRLLIEEEKGIEINTGGLVRGLRDLHPCKEVVKRYRELGGEIITIGSDAHKPADLARSFDRAASVLQDCGFKYYTTFENRLPEYHKL
ncbi:MAG: histidinol-phosphatase HisJ family protein [Lachnospiraceae bacterium]|nr:histidinol-phosphatase HisJ family protein [Lachnospiraceae bacterium]